MYFPLFVRVLYLSLLWYVLLCAQFCNHLEEEEIAACFVFIVLRMSCYYKCSIALPHGTVGWSVVCDCGISLSYSLTFCFLTMFIS